MSDFGDAIINRTNNKQLLKKNNPMRKIIDYAIGGWLQNEDETPFFEEFFLQEATGKYLDLHGKDYNIPRKLDETDEDYRNRIIYESLGHLTVNFLIDVYNVQLYSYVPDFNVADNTLTSDNPYLNINGFMGVADETTRAILNKKFIIDEGVRWL